MKKYIVAGFAASLLGSVAFTQPAYAADVEAFEFDWTGLYIGGHIGYGEADFSGEWDPSEDPPLDMDELNLDGWAAGAQLGYNHQINSFVLGIEGDVTVTNWNDWAQHKDDGSDFSSSMAGRVDLLASLRGRLGVAFDRSLIYGTAGVAIADASLDALDGGDDNVKFDFNDLGGVVGGGFEYAVADNVSLRAEGLYYFFNDKKKFDDDGDVDSEDGDHVKFDDAYVIRVGLNWLIN